MPLGLPLSTPQRKPMQATNTPAGLQGVSRPGALTQQYQQPRPQTPMPAPMPTSLTQIRPRNYASGGYYPPQGSNDPAFGAAAGIYDTVNNQNAANIQAQMDILQQMQAAQNPQQMMDLVTQLTLAQSAAHGSQTHWINQQQQFGQQQWQQQQDYIKGQLGFSQEGYGLEVAQNNQQRLEQLQNAGLSRDQALAVMDAEYKQGQLQYQTGLATAQQQRDYGFGKVDLAKDTSLRGAMEDAAARGATASLGYRNTHSDIGKEWGIERQNLQATFDIRQTYETTAWKNLQEKISQNKQLTQREYDMLVEQANKEAELANQSAWLGHKMDWETLQNQMAQGSLAYQQNQAGLNNQQQAITDAEVIRDLQWQMQMLGLQNPSNMLGLQSQWLNYQNQLSNMPYNSLGNILNSVMSGLPMPSGGSGGSGRPNTPYLPGQYPGGR